jgi:hypothetical protein
MCDYSLERVASRAAVKGDRLITTQFAQSFTTGFATEADPNTAVCLLPGTEIAFENTPQYGRSWLFWSKKAGSTSARFRKINLNDRHRHHDAVEFEDGTRVLLSKLTVGQRATVLQLPKTVSEFTAVADRITPTKIVERNYSPPPTSPHLFGKRMLRRA